jgi:hypothetical protein
LSLLLIGALEGFKTKILKLRRFFEKIGIRDFKFWKFSFSTKNSGSVSGAYAAGAALGNAGVILGADMTPEATLAKLSYVLARKETSQAQKREMMETNLRGELTQPDLGRLSLSSSTFLSTVAAAMRASSEAEMKQIKARGYRSLWFNGWKCNYFWIFYTFVFVCLTLGN